MQSDVMPLTEALLSEVNKLNACLEQDQRHLKNHDLEQLEQSNVAKSTINDSIATLIATLNKFIDIKNDASLIPDLSAYVQIHSDSLPSMPPLLDALEKATQQTKTLMQTNAAVLNANMQSLHAFVGSLTNAPHKEDNDVYGASGRVLD